ncbi:MAG TPA: MtnX-like HAD-IB family phosphatase [Blastocatellia bacterium]|nr:MtnX-like HAD-IB family phosphatase [Blastocatellia bacterium]
MAKLHIFSDFDGTITEQDTLIFLASNLGGGPGMVEAIGRLLSEGKLSLRDGIAGEMRSIRAPFAEAEKLLREQVRIDPGFHALAGWCAERQIPLTILSAGFHQIIDLFISPEQFPGVEIFANELNPDQRTGWQCVFRDQTDFGHDKAQALRSARKRGEYVIFIGDGLSDCAAAAAADEVFAKHSLADYCREQGIKSHEYRMIGEVLEHLKRRF